MFLLLAALNFFETPLPLDMPRAEGYLVREEGVYRLEDRYDKFDLWISRSVDGRWLDADDRFFILAHLDVLPPAGEAAHAVATREEYVKERVAIEHRDLKAVRTAVAALCSEALPSVEIPEREIRPRQMPRGMKDVDYWQGTNRSAIVCAYLPEKEKVWRLALWQLAEGDDFDEMLKSFEDEFFETVRKKSVRGVTPRPGAESSERSLLRADARHSVSAYENWHVTEGGEFVVLDALPSSRDFIAAATNDLSALRLKCAEMLPTHVDGSNVLCVARIYSDRGDYLDALECEGLTNMLWSGAYWSPSRRELVAYNSGDASLLPTLRHESFHQYLSYALAMIPASPWLNEGYAQFFEYEEWKKGTAEWRTDFEAKPTAEDLERYSLMLPSILTMDYDAFYSGSDAARRLKYKLAWSIAVFLEKGAPLVRFKPFATLKKDYFASLFETRDMVEATQVAFQDREFLEKFQGEWLKFWKER